VVTLRTPRFKV